MQRCLLSLLLLVSVLLAPHAALASGAEEGVALLVPSQADLDDGEYRALVALVQRVVDTRFPGASAHTAMPVLDTMRLMGCSSVERECLESLLELLGVQAIVVTEVERNASGRRELRVRHLLFPGDTALVDARIPLQAGDVTRHVAERMTSILAGRATLEIRTSQVGDEVLVEGRLVGTTPLVLNDLVPGTLLVRVRRDGRVASQEVPLPAPGVWEASFADDAFRTPWGAGRTAGVVLLTGAAGLGTLAIVQGMGAAREQDRFDETPWRAEADAIASSGRRKARIATASTIGAVGLAGVGLWLTFRSPVEDDAATGRIRTGLAPALHGVGGGGLTLRVQH